MPSTMSTRSVRFGNTGTAKTAAYMSRKPLLKHTVQAQERQAFCECGGALVRRRQTNSTTRNSAVSAAPAIEAPVKGNTRKRKQPVEPLLVVEDVSKTHDGQRYLFENVYFTVNRGDRLALVGPNGAGKSSLFKLLSGVAAPMLPYCRPSLNKLGCSCASQAGMLH